MEGYVYFAVTVTGETATVGAVANNGFGRCETKNTRSFGDVYFD